MSDSTRYGTIYAWICPLAGEGIVAAVVPGIGATPLVTLDENSARGRIGDMARAVAHVTGRPVQLVRWTDAEVLETVGGDV